VIEWVIEKIKMDGETTACDVHCAGMEIKSAGTGGDGYNFCRSTEDYISVQISDGQTPIAIGI